MNTELNDRVRLVEETSRLCNEWFTQSQERQTYKRLLEKLDNDK